ncbi:glycosyltransferase family 39 protein [Candidatus Woesearchaeota archaeon]|nr:glycosyltransferase family 39 protein [Candidatus Woesearchaeota archaeon]
MKPRAKQNKYIFLILLIFSLISFLTFNNTIRWDSAVYVGMGKFIYSSGNAGFWEPARPIIWPLFLGAVWKLGLDSVVFGKILGVLFGVGCIHVTYLIGRELFDRRVALTAALFLAFTPAFFFFNTKILSAIPSLFFMLLSVYFFINKKYFLTGLFAGISFLTRFLELFVFFVIFILFLIYFSKEKKFFLRLCFISGGFLSVLVPYLVFNYLMYANIFYPFDLQLFLTKNTGWVFHEPFWFYFVNLFKENFLFLFAIPGIIYIFKKPDYKKFAVLFSFLLFFVFFTFTAHKEVRFIIVFLPYLCIIASYGIFNVFSKIKNKKLVFYFFLLVFLFWFIQTSYQIKNNYDNEIKVNEFAVFQDYLKNVYGNIWISNPGFAANSDKKINELMYYPTFNRERFINLRNTIIDAENVLVNTCDFYCEPYNEFCEEDKKELIKILKNNFDEIFYKKEWVCESYIFSK